MLHLVKVVEALGLCPPSSHHDLVVRRDTILGHDIRAPSHVDKLLDAVGLDLVFSIINECVTFLFDVMNNNNNATIDQTNIGKLNCQHLLFLFQLPDKKKRHDFILFSS